MRGSNAHGTADNYVTPRTAQITKKCEACNGKMSMQAIVQGSGCPICGHRPIKNTKQEHYRTRTHANMRSYV